MKKSTIINFIIIVGLLILCVMTLLAVYGTTPESSVLLLHETFSDLDENKWNHEISSCTEDNNQFHYLKENGETGFTADGVLRIFSNPPIGESKIKRETTLNKCLSCSDCNDFLFSAILETKSIFYAKAGKLEIRAKFQRNNGMRFRIGLISNTSNSEGSKTAVENEEKAIDNNFVQLSIVIKSNNTETTLKSEVPNNDFHVYKLEWDSNKILLSIDEKKINEKRITQIDETKDFSNSTGQSENFFSNTPFYLILRADFGDKLMESSGIHSRDEFLNKTKKQGANNFTEESVFEVDYIKLFRIGN